MVSVGLGFGVALGAGVNVAGTGLGIFAGAWASAHPLKNPDSRTNTSNDKTSIFISNRHAIKKRYNLDVFKISKNDI